MRKYSVDKTVRVRVLHRAGALARLATTIGDAGGLLGEIGIVGYGEHDTVRDLVVGDPGRRAHRADARAIRALDQVEVINVTDTVFDRHRGGKIQQTSRVELKDVTDLRYIYTPGVARVSRAIKRRMISHGSSPELETRSASSQTGRACSASATSARSRACRS